MLFFIQIWWTKLAERSPERPVLLAAGSQVRIPDDRLRVLTYPDNTYSVLVIKDVLPADAGRYKCSLPTVSGTKTSFTSLKVLGKLLILNLSFGCQPACEMYDT